MCGRYFIDGDDLPEELERILEELNRKNTPKNLKTSGEIFLSEGQISPLINVNNVYLMHNRELFTHNDFSVTRLCNIIALNWKQK